MSTRIALCDTRGPLVDLLEKISGVDGERWLRALKLMLREENPWDITIQDLSLWRTVTLGTSLKTADAFRAALQEAGMKIGSGANDILGTPASTVAADKTTLDLVMVSVSELGFKQGATRAQIYWASGSSLEWNLLRTRAAA